MPVIRRIYVSMPSDRWLAPNQNDLKWGIVEEIEQLGYTPEIFTDPTGRPGLAARQAWSALNVLRRKAPKARLQQRSVRISASREALDRQSPMNPHPISLSKSPIKESIARFAT
jgi:hypothetical protein